MRANYRANYAALIDSIITNQEDSSRGSSRSSTEYPELMDTEEEMVYAEKEKDNYEEIRRIIDSYEDGCCLTESKILDIEVTDFEVTIKSSVLQTRVQVWNDYSKELEADLKSILPYISELDDGLNPFEKAVLLKWNAFPIYLLRRIHALSINGLLLSDGRFIQMAALRLIYGDELIEGMLRVTTRIKELGFNDADIAMCIPLSFYKQRATLSVESAESFLNAQQKFKLLFVEYMQKRGFEEWKGLELIQMLLPELHRLKYLHQEIIEFLKPYRWTFPNDSLFTEVYDIEFQPCVAYYKVKQTASVEC